MSHPTTAQLDNFIVTLLPKMNYSGFFDPCTICLNSSYLYIFISYLFHWYYWNSVMSIGSIIQWFSNANKR